MTSRYLIRTTLVTVIYGKDFLIGNESRRVLIIAFCYREDLAREFECPPSALRFEFWGRHLHVTSNAKTIIDRNLAVAEGRSF